MDGVTYVHAGQRQPTLRGLSFALAPGEALGILGPTAAGKTTLARLLVGNIAPLAGHVRLDGADLANWDPQDRGPYVGYLPQDVELFDGSLRDNIARFSDAQDAAVVAAARQAGAHEMILHLPAGYDTDIGDDGMAVSGGQRQRIGLARALFGSPRLVVLDEPNANLDSDGEAALLSALAGLKEDGVTAVIIAHRPNVLRTVDKVLVLRDGTMQAFGPRDEVLKQVLAPSVQREAS